MSTRSSDPPARSGIRLSRRRFIEATATTGALAALGSLARAQNVPVVPEPWFSACSLAKAIREKHVSAAEAVKHSLEAIETMNPQLDAIVSVCAERALAEAAAADAALRKGRIKGALHGVPFTMSDAFDTQGVVSGAGTSGRRNFVPSRDATVVARLRAAGAILIGKSRTAELSLGPRPSAGGGALVAAGASAFDLDADLSGLVREPAAANGLAGLKPTFGRMPRTGHILGYGGAFDTFVESGPLARRVEDLALLLSLLCGPDYSDAAMVPVPLGDPARVALRSLRVATLVAGLELKPDPAMASVVARFEAAGSRVTTDIPPRMREFGELCAHYLAGDGGEHVRRLLRRCGTSQASSTGIGTEMNDLPSPEFTRVREEIDAIKAEQLEWFQACDLLICPSASPAPAGWPFGIVRVGTTTAGLPLTVQLVARPWREDVLLAALAYAEIGA